MLWPVLAWFGGLPPSSDPVQQISASLSWFLRATSGEPKGMGLSALSVCGTGPTFPAPYQPSVPGRSMGRINGLVPNLDSNSWIDCNGCCPIRPSSTDLCGRVPTALVKPEPLMGELMPVTPTSVAGPSPQCGLIKLVAGSQDHLFQLLCWCWQGSEPIGGSCLTYVHSSLLVEV